MPQAADDGPMREPWSTGAVIDAAPDAFVAVDAELRVLAWNRAAALLLGWEADEVVGTPDPSIPPELVEPVRHRVDRLLRGAQADVAEAVTRQRRDGTRLELMLLATVILGSPEDPAGLGVWFTESGVEQRRLRERNHLSRALVDAIREDDVVKVLRHAIASMLETERAVVLSPCPERLHLHGTWAIGGYPEDAERVALDLQGGEAWTLAAQGEAGTGTLTIAELTAAPTLFVPMGPLGQGWVLALVYPDGLPTTNVLVGLARAVADEAWLALQRAQLVGDLEGQLEVLEATAAVASSADLDLQATATAVARRAATAMACERAGVYLRDADGELALVAMHATDLDLTTEAGARVAREVLDRGEMVLIQDAATCDFLDGPWHETYGAVSVFGLPLRVAGRDIGVLVVAHTVSHPRGFTHLCQRVGTAVAQQAALALEHARLFEAQQAALRQLQELDQLKADYIAGITHDLRTPLTALLGFVQTLRRMGDTVSPEDQRNYLAVMERQADRLVAMVEDLLLAARMDEGHVLPAALTTIDVAGMVREIVEAYEPERAQRLRVDADPDVPTVEGDRDQIARIVANVIDNALKYSPADEPVEVSLSSSGRGCVELRVLDRGEGIDPDEREHIFERFGRGAAGSRAGSTGLGLFISRGIARGHGGELVVAAPPAGRTGACFVLTLPSAHGERCS